MWSQVGLSITMNKASGGDGIPVELFQILKDDAMKVLHSICQQIWKTWQWPENWKRSVFIPISKKANAKECSNYPQLHSSHTLARWCSKFSKPGFNSTWTVNFQMFKLHLENAKEPEIKLPTSTGSKKKQGSSRKSFTSVSLTMLKPLTVWITTNCGKFLKRWEYQTSWETCIQVKKQQLEPDLEQGTVSKLGKEYFKAVYCHSAYLTSMHSTLCKMPGWVKHKLESRFSGEISTTSDMQMTPL